MKHIAISLIALCLFISSCDTNSGVSKAFLKYSHHKGVTSITVPRWLISIGARFGDLSENERELLENIDKVKVLTIENDELNKRINLHSEFHTLINTNNDFEELLTVQNQGDNVTIFGKMTGDVIKEMVVLAGGDENVLVYLKGNLKPEMFNGNIDISHPDKFISFNF